MFAKLKAAFSLLASGQGAKSSEEPAAPAVEYKGYRIKAAPYLANGSYQTCGIIEKDMPDGPKEHRFVRADTYQSRDTAIEFTVSKAKQIIDMQGDQIFT